MAKHILVLSSKAEVIQRPRDTLEPEGYRVTVAAADADIAREITQITALTGQGPDSVILDLGSEDEVRASEERHMRCLGEIEDRARPRVIVLKPPGPHHGGYQSYRSYAEVYLSERFHPRELLAFVGRMIGPADSALVRNRHSG
ncbi:MAG: hypothetical protein V4671_06015 [Armatimonadota bacterium]